VGERRPGPYRVRPACRPPPGAPPAASAGKPWGSGGQRGSPSLRGSGGRCGATPRRSSPHSGTARPRWGSGGRSIFSRHSSPHERDGGRERLVWMRTSRNEWREMHGERVDEKRWEGMVWALHPIFPPPSGRLGSSITYQRANDAKYSVLFILVAKFEAHGRLRR
jgi:hypothetical protein